MSVSVSQKLWGTKSLPILKWHQCPSVGYWRQHEQAGTRDLPGGVRLRGDQCPGYQVGRGKASICTWMVQEPDKDMSEEGVHVSLDGPRARQGHVKGQLRHVRVWSKSMTVFISKEGFHVTLYGTRQGHVGGRLWHVLVHPGALSPRTGAASLWRREGWHTTASTPMPGDQVDQGSAQDVQFEPQNYKFSP